MIFVILVPSVTTLPETLKSAMTYKWVYSTSVRCVSVCSYTDLFKRKLRKLINISAFRNLTGVKPIPQEDEMQLEDLVKMNCLFQLSQVTQNLQMEDLNPVHDLVLEFSRLLSCLPYTANQLWVTK